MTSFPTPDAVRARIEIEMGDIRVVAAVTASTDVEVAPTDPLNERDRRAAEETRVTCADGRLDVVGPRRSAVVGVTRRSGSVQVSVRLPVGSSVEARTAVGLVDVDGELTDVSAKTSAGDVRVDEATTADLTSGLGTITAGHVSGDLRASTGSGSIRVHRVDGSCLLKNSNGATWIGVSGPSTRAKSANGSIVVDRARGDVWATTANGDLRLGCAERGSVMLQTSLGSIALGIPHGTAARLGLRTSFGRVRNELAAAEGPGSGDRTLDVDAQTSAGDIDVVRALVDDE